MARPSSTAQQRQLTLTEELEKLEQSITLTLQEIDHNFSRAHRIVTSSILPIVEQYATHSKDVWEGSKFWKQFFESSANVSLSGYEEQQYNQPEDGQEQETVTEDSHASTHPTLETSSYDTPSAQHISTDSIQDLDLSNMTISPSKSSTPRPSTKQLQQDQTATFADYPSPYEALREQVNQTAAVDTTSLDQTHSPTNNLPTTPGRQQQQPTLVPSAIAMTPQSSPFLPPHPQPSSIPRPSTSRKRSDPLLHRLLDRNYRIQATPLTSQKYSLPKPSTTAAPEATTHRNRKLFESPLSSSPDVAPPQLHQDIFSSPQRKPRTPGVSVLTPARTRPDPTQPVFTPGTKPSGKAAYDSDDNLDDSDLPFGSPPKTMQFHVPQSRLIKTPAKEASQRIVNSILETARYTDPNNDNDDTLDDDDEAFELDLDFGEHNDYEDNDNGNNDLGHRHNRDLDDTSPSVVRRMAVQDETF